MSVFSTEQFQEAQPSSLSLFSLPPTQTAIEKISFQEVRPISQLTGYNTPIEFLISGQNGMEAELFANGTSVDMEGAILGDLFNLDRLVLNSVQMSVKLYRSKPEFCLMTDEQSPDYQIFIEDIILKVCKVQVNPAVIYGQAEVLKHENAKYPFTRTEIKQVSIPAGQINFTFDNIFQGLRPNKVVVAFVKSEAVAGAWTLNPFNFHHFDLSQIGLFVDSVPVSGNIMKLNYDNTIGQTTIPAFTQMFEITDKWMCDSGNQLDRHDLAGGYALYCFEIEPNFGNDMNYLSLLKQGNVRLEAQFNKPLPTATTCIIYAEYPGYFEINGARDIVIE
ncbi:hypothetical protein KUTeg_009160 [Tegillarca granosa]|uniref:Uncharacterized protein n=1 Tax=Tegillarca granosa TaxID=220873 RepID=A0ABQ9EP86_TEGGR|nr:hypothetical protein KUTeg_017242 [Tegillarca granosa]KAJ8313287.1 hypothetical protein KUTeg_009160 [Tegillarca granosa]